MIRLKIAALAGVLLIGLLAVMPLIAVAPEAEERFKDCEKIQKEKVCFFVLLTNEEVSLSDPFPGFDTWLYVRNPSEDIRREISLFPDDPAGEDNVVVESLTITITEEDGTEFGFVLTPDILPDRWDPVVHAFETKRVFFVGFFVGGSPPGEVIFEYELAMTFRGESFTLAVDFEVEIVE